MYFVQSDGSNSALSPIVYGDIVQSIKKHNTIQNCFLGLLHGNMLPVYGTYSMGYTPFGFELFLHPLPFIRAIRAVQLFVLEFSKDGSANLLQGFADGGAANQPVIVQGGVGHTSGQGSQGYGQFESNFQWLPEIVD